MELVKNALTRILGIFSIFLFFSPAKAESAFWSSPSVISTPNQNASNPQVGLDANGNVVALWMEFGFVKSSNKPVNGNWSSPVTLSGSGASSPQLAVDLSGNATAIWIENGIVNTARQPFNGSWGASSALSSPGASSPQLAQDASGNLVAIWVLNGVIQSATRPFGGSWPVTPDTLSSSGMDFPQVAIGANGNVVAVWHGILASMNTIYAANKSINGSWNSAQPISSSSYDCGYPKVDVDLNGNAVAVWFRYQVAGTSYSNVVLQATNCPYNGNWTTAVDLSKPGFYNPALLSAGVNYDGQGNAIAVWSTSFDGSSFFYEVSIHPAGGTWSSTNDLIGQNLYAYGIDLAVDAFGHAFGVYMLNNPSQSTVEIHSRKIDLFAYNPGWCLSYATLSQGAYNGYPQAAAVTTGNNIYTAAVWLSYDGTNTNIVAATGKGTIFAPPSNLSVVQNSRDKFLFTEYYNTLSWQPSTNPKVQGYYVFRNGVYINNVLAGVTQIVDENRNPSESDTYGVAAYSADFSQSQIVTITYP